MEEYLWCERYRPQTIKDCALPSSIRDQFQKMVDTKNIPNMIFSGEPGVGKTTVAKALVKEIGCDSYVLNASLKGNIDTLRTEIMDFASSVSMKGGRKYVILDEADKVSAAFQEGLRAFIEEFSKNAGFILTCNYKARLIPAIHSRCPVIDFRIPKDEFKSVFKQLYLSLAKMLETEKIPYDKTALVEVLKKYYPDARATIGILQRYALGAGKIDSGILVNFTEERLKALVAAMQQKNFTAVRSWVTDNSDIDTNDLYRRFYDQASALVTPESIPALVMILARYQYQVAFVADVEINSAACLAELMCEITWK